MKSIFSRQRDGGEIGVFNLLHFRFALLVSLVSFDCFGFRNVNKLRRSRVIISDRVKAASRISRISRSG